MIAALIIVVVGIRNESPGYISEIMRNVGDKIGKIRQAFSELSLGLQSSRKEATQVSNNKQKSVKAIRPIRQSKKADKGKEIAPSQAEKLKQENSDLKKMYSELSLEHRKMKKELKKLRAQKKGKKA